MSRSNSHQPAEALLCDLSAIPPDRRADHVALVRSLFGDANAVRQIENGVAISLAPDRLAHAVSFIDHERRCCRHLAFILEVPAGLGPLTVRVIGPGAAQEIQALVG